MNHQRRRFLHLAGSGPRCIDHRNEMNPRSRDKEREQLSLKKRYDWHALALLALITALVIIIAFVFWLRLSR
jgi:hypothetical protein